MIMTDEEKLLFLPHVNSRHTSAVIENARILQRKFAMIHEVSPALENLNGKKELEYFSNLFDETVPVLTSIIRFVCDNGIADKKEVEMYVSKALKILGYLKILHLRYKSVYVFPHVLDKPAWYRYSQLENREIVEELKKIINL